MPKRIIESDESLDDSIEEPEAPNKKEIEIGSYKSHLETAKKGINDYKIWPNLNIAVVAMAHQNDYHRVDLRDKDMLKKLESDLNLKIDYDSLENEIMSKPFLLQPNGVRGPIDRTKDEKGKPLSKKALKINSKKDKIQAKIDVLQKKYDGIKKKKGPRAEKLKAKINELEIKRDRM